MIASAQPRFLHVTNGTSVTMTMAGAGPPGAYSIWADPLYSGPVLGGLNDAELVEARARYLGPADAPEHDIRNWREPLLRHEAFDELILWFEHDTFDQLNLIHLLTWIREHLPSSKPVSLICIDAFPGRPNFKGLGELQADELVSLLPTRQPVDETLYELASQAWRAFRESTPEALNELRRGDTTALPFLAEAITRLLQEYPWTRDGLSRSERRLLTLAEGDGIAVRTAFPRMHNGERVHHVTDRMLTDLVTDLSATTPALLTLDLPGDEGHVMSGRVKLTEAGRAVLAGSLDRVTACGLDRWYGGTHLQNGSPIWRWDDTRQTICR